VTRPFILSLLLSLWPLTALHAQSAAAAQSEASKCRDRIAAVRRDVLGKYDDQLGELQTQCQKAADLEGALAVRAERQRVRGEQMLAEANFVAEPRALRALQQQTATRLEELTSGVVGEVIPRLVELKKALTVSGQLDDAVAVRKLIEQLQNDHVPLARPANGELVTEETLTTAYAADRARADKAYKGVVVTVRGTLATYRVDPNDPRRASIYLGRSGGAGWVGCFFDDSVRFREDRSFNTVALVVTSAAGSPVARWQAGQTIEISGKCDGFEDVVRLLSCELPR
jgi:hypothetical protein